MTLYHNISKNIWKTWLLLSIFIAIFAVFGFLVSYYFESSAFVYIAIIYAIGSSFVAYWFSDKIILSMSGAQKIEKQNNPYIYNIVENLCIASGMPIPKIYMINDKSPNAFATGRNPKHSAICVTRGLLDILDRSELEAVIAHELSHIKNYDILIASLVVVLANAITWLSHIALRASRWSDSGKSKNNEGGGYLTMIIMIAFIAFAILSPIVAMLIQLAVSRKREFLADSSGALMTRYPEGLISALQKISSNPTPMRKVNDYTRNLYISDPAKQKITAFNKLFLTHPPVEERIKALQQIKKP